MRRFVTYLAVGIIGLIGGLYVGANFRKDLKASPIPIVQSFSNPDIRQTPDGETQFTSPLLECAELPESMSDAFLDITKKKVHSFIDASKRRGDISEASVYFRDLNNGPWFGINENVDYFPASLLKLPLAMSFYAKSENDPTLLSKELVYTPDPSVTSQVQPFGDKDKLQAGKRYSIQELLDLMLTDSNNEAANALAVYGGQSMIDNVYYDLGLAAPQPGQDYNISTHRYASFFRVLYNATYVNKMTSEKILKTMGDASFNDGLVAGVPQSVNVSHKFGTRQVDQRGTVQLHDCGIIYAPQKPYILCVMTQGNDFNALAGVIKNISALVYGAVTNTQ